MVQWMGNTCLNKLFLNLLSSSLLVGSLYLKMELEIPKSNRALSRFQSMQKAPFEK